MKRGRGGERKRMRAKERKKRRDEPRRVPSPVVSEPF